MTEPPSDPHPRESSESPVPMSTFATVWLVLFLDLVAFGIVIPVLPYYAQAFGASAAVVTLLSTTYSLAQFVMSPVLGRTSDRYGRRPVLLVSIAGSCVAMVVLGFASSLWMLFAARVVSGVCTANVSTAQAYVADRVRPADRARYMGMMGSAIGLGFVFGPAIGGVLSLEGHPEMPFLVAAALSAANFLLALKFVPESRRRRPSSVGTAIAASSLRQIFAALWGTLLGWLVVVNFLFFFAFSTMESTFALLQEARLGWTARETGYLFTGIGVVIVLTQGFLVGRLVAWIREKRTLLIGLTVLVVGFTTVGVSATVLPLVVGAACLACGNGLVTPNVSALVSRGSDEDRQGLNLGLSAAAASLARICGPAVAGVVFETIGPGVPMLVAAAVVAVALVTAGAAIRQPSGA